MEGAAVSFPRRQGQVDRLLQQIRRAGVTDPRILDAFAKTPRNAFVPAALEVQAWEDVALPIGQGQTISQPSMVALMLEALELEEHHSVLDVGTGSGYQAALLARLVARVVSIERIPEHAQAARTRLRSLGLNLVVLQADGSRGWSEGAPYDAIAVAAAAPELPTPLLEQLAVGGRMVVPIGPKGQAQQLQVVQRTPKGHRILAALPCTFVPLVGAHGYADGAQR